MDVTTIQMLASGVIVALTPALAKAISAAGGPIKVAGEELAKALGQAAGDQAAALLRALGRKFKGNAAAEEAFTDFAKTPEDKDTQASLRHQLKKILQTDEAFVQELRELLEVGQEPLPGTRTVIAGGERSVAAGNDVNAPVITGDIKGDVKTGS